MKELSIKKVIIHKSGISYFILEGSIEGSDKFELEFKIEEMDDVLKSLFVLDTSEKGFISSISYDAALKLIKLLLSDCNSLELFKIFLLKKKVVKIKK